MIRLRSGRIQIALHTLVDRPGPCLLGVHELGGSHRDFETFAERWPGAVHALDLSGHGASDRLKGRAYSSEDWAADADVALRHLGGAWVVGKGVGAFAALLLAGARPESALGTLLLPGRGLAGNGEGPDEARMEADRRFLKLCLETATQPDREDFDPLAIETESHHRPRRYARDFAERAMPLLLAENGDERPPWWEELRELSSTSQISGDAPAAMAEFAARAEG